MNGSQLKLAGGIAATLACIIFVLTFGNQQTFTKHDLLGVVPDMNREQVRKLTTSRKWTCAVAPSNDTIVCKTEAGSLSIAFASGADAATVTGVEIQLVNREQLSFAETVKAITAQYNQAASEISSNRADWKLDDRLTLHLEHKSGFTLRLSHINSAG